MSRYLKKPTGKVGNCLLGKRGFHSELPQVQLQVSDRENYFGSSYRAHRLSVLPVPTGRGMAFGHVSAAAWENQDRSPKGPHGSTFTVWFRGCLELQLGHGSNLRPLVLQYLSPTSSRILILQK